MQKILIVIDMLKDFIDPKGKLYCGSTASAIVPNVKNLVDKYREEGNLVFFLNDCHAENDLEFVRFPPHSIEGTDGAKIIDVLDFKADRDVIITKTRYSGFFDTDLDFEMGRRDLEPEDTEVEVCGVCTSICVMLTIADLANRDYNTTVRKDCVADFDQVAHEFALGYMKSILGAEII